MRGGEFTRGVHEDLQVRSMDPEERLLTLFPSSGHMDLVDWRIDEPIPKPVSERLKRSSKTFLRIFLDQGVKE